MNIPKSRSIPVEFFHKIMEYREEYVDGVLQGNVYWKHREDKPNNWNTLYAGKKAGSINGNGYYSVQITYNKSLCNMKLHIIIWVLNKNKYPDNVIDHIDRNRINNLIDNLEDSTLIDNANNRVANSNSYSHFRAVQLHKTKNFNKWRVRVTSNGVQINYGIFYDEIEAAQRANEALIENFGHTKNLRLNDISMGYTNQEYPNMPRGWKPEQLAA
jgi:hypothetical protein